QRHRFGQTGRFGTLKIIADQAGGNIDAVENIADVMQHAGGDFGHSCLPGSVQHRLLRLFQPALSSFALRDIPEDDLNAHQHPARIQQRALYHLNKDILTAGIAAFFDSFEQFAAGDDPLVIGSEFGGQVGGKEVEIALAQDLVEGLANRAAEEIVGKSETAREIL